MFVTYLRYAAEICSGKRARCEHHISRLRQKDLGDFLPQHDVLSVLDLANGALRPQTYLLAKEGHRVVGIDFKNAPVRSFADVAYAVCRSLFQIQIGLSPFRRRNILLLAADAERLPLKDSSIDLVTSCAAIEHFLDVPTVVSELARVVRPGGVIWSTIHLFSSLTGGHDIYWGLKARGVRRPWAHLSDPDWKASVPLNRLRAQDYLDIFSRHFDVKKSSFSPEGSLGYLTPAIRSELSAFSEEELTSSLTLMAVRHSS